MSTTRDALSLTAATLDRGTAVRTLRETLERAYADDERWPEAIDVPAGVTYRRPTRPTTTPARLPDPLTTTVVIEESFAAHPDGVWIGYADGHVEQKDGAIELAHFLLRFRPAVRVSIGASGLFPQH